MDEQLKAPVLEYKNGDNLEYATECFITQEGLEVNNTYEDRLYEYKTSDTENTEYESISKKAYAGICPDFLLN